MQIKNVSREPFSVGHSVIHEGDIADVHPLIAEQLKARLGERIWIEESLVADETPVEEVEEAETEETDETPKPRRTRKSNK